MLFDGLLASLGYDKNFVETTGGTNPPAELGNRIAAAIIAFGSSDGANEDDPVEAYSDSTYTPVNEICRVDLPFATQPPAVGEPAPPLADPNRWQPLALDFLVLQNGIIVGEAVQTFLGSHWGGVTPFALTNRAPVYSDPGDPPYLGCPG
ncbi:MAG: hypothetical protein GWN07_33145, partial [Actinobacteria bacterium]|nr:hypothetical protein [Actinomycetota bacterium]